MSQIVSSANSTVQMQRIESVLVITIHRPEVKNAIDRATSEALAQAMDTLDADPELVLGILTGAGGHFCTGMDLKAFLRGERVELPGRGLAGMVQTPPRKPLIAAIEGYALAGGFEMALACDLIVAAEDARFVMAYGQVGLSPDGGASWRAVIGARTIGRPTTAYATPIGAEAVAFDPRDADRLVVGNAEFVLGTTDGGRSWRDLTSDVLPDGSAVGRGYSGLVATRITYSPDGADLVLCGMDGANPLVRTARRTGWTRPLAPTDQWGGCADAAFSRAVPGRRYVLVGQAGTFGGVAVIEPDDRARLRAGAAAGLPERRARAGELGAVEVVTVGGRELVLVAVGGVLYRSSDGAETFEVLDRDLGATELTTGPGDRLYVAGARGVAVSDDGGGSFRLLPGSPADAVRLAVDPTGTVYVTVWRTAGAGLWRYDGTSFASILDEVMTFDVAIDPADAAHLLVATNDHPYHDVIRSSGVLESVDAGAS